MMATVRFCVPGPVVPYQRPSSYLGRRLTPVKTRAYRKHVQACAALAIPRAWSMSARMAVHIRSYRSTRHAYDLDNVAKAILDALNGVAFADDRQVDELLVLRRQCAAGSECVVIEIAECKGAA